MTKKNKILQIALKHFSDKGYESTSLDDIAKELNLTKPALYYHFKNKKELYNQIFLNYFDKLELKKDLKDYIDRMGDLFLKNPPLAKLFSKELSSEMVHLENDTIKSVSKTLKILSEILEDKNVNPFFIQTLIVASFTTYINTLEVRKKVSKVWGTHFITDFNVIDEIYKTISLYIKQA